MVITSSSLVQNSPEASVFYIPMVKRLLTPHLKRDYVNIGALGGIA